MRALLTGATGFVGQYILWSLLRQSVEGDAFYCLVRAGSRSEAEQRLTRLLEDAPGEPLPQSALARCHVLWGDITEPELVFRGGDATPLPDDIDRVIHCAATVKFNLPLAQARQINLDGTRHVVRCAQRQRALRRFDYIGTAFVAGTAAGLIPEEELRQPPAFHNSYEQTKWEAEGFVREVRQDLPASIFRPSIVVGDSSSGHTANFRVLYAPLKLLSQGVALFAPADPQGNVDVVPINYVVDTFNALCATDASIGKCYHLAAGPLGQNSIEELTIMAAKFFGVRTPWLIGPQIWSPLFRPLSYLLYFALWGERRQQLDRISHYFPYFAYRASFDTASSHSILTAAGIEPPSVKTYFRTILQYCIDTNWGEKAPDRKAKRRGRQPKSRHARQRT